MPNHTVRSAVVSCLVGAAAMAAFPGILVRAEATEAPAAAPAPEKQTWESYVPPHRTRAERIATCIALWETATHMTKGDWKRTCERVETAD
jgi:hypothetical protein